MTESVPIKPPEPPDDQPALVAEIQAASDNAPVPLDKPDEIAGGVIEEVGTTITQFLGLDLSDWLTLLVAIFAALIAFFVPWTQRRISRRQSTISLHQSYWSVENYLRVIAPSFGVRLNWAELSEQYRETVLKGWTETDKSGKYGLYMGPEPVGDPAEQHFRKATGKDKLTEHQALTLSLYWWSQCATYYRHKLVDRELFHDLFRDTFGYTREFLLEFCDAVQKELGEGADIPQWIESIRFLEEEVFDMVQKRMPSNELENVKVSVETESDSLPLARSEDSPHMKQPAPEGNCPPN